MIASRLRIAILLPRRERYAITGAGAVSTVVDGLSTYSSMRSSIKILGSPVNVPLRGGEFIPIYPAPIWQGSKTKRYLIAAAKAIDSPDIVEVHNRPKYIEFLRKRLPCTALILYLHNDPRTMANTETPEERAHIYEQVQAVVCVSEYIKSCFLEGTKGLDSKVFVIRNAIDVGMIFALPDQKKHKEIIFVGRTIYDKGPHLLVEAAEKLLPLYPEWRIVVIGGRYFESGRAEEYEKNLFCRISALGQQGEITGYLPRAEVLSRLRQASIAVLPSLWEEPIQLAAMEAAACGCAVITTRRGGIPEGMGNSALYLGEENADAIVRILRQLMDNPDQLQKWQQKARSHVEQYCDLRTAAQKLDSLRAKICCAIYG